MMITPEFLARIQFGTNISFHILFPSLTIALTWILLFFKLRYSRTKNEAWQEAYRFWVKIFALSFALGVGSGITMSFQFGTNWPGYMEKVGNIAGPLIGYEVMTAFFLEATFLGIMLFGQNRVSEKLHTAATLLVALGTTFSSFWIIVLNSWMQTPQGFEMIDGKAVVTDWLAVIFTPSMFDRLLHMLLASGLTAAFVVAGISAYQKLKGDRSNTVHVAFKTGIFLAAILIPIQGYMGDRSGLEVLKNQPEKLAAIEAIWETGSDVAWNIIAFPNEKERKNDFEISIPHVGSLILTHSWDGTVRGLNDFKDAHPPVAPVFWSFRVMVGIAGLMLIFSWYSAVKLLRKREFSPPLLKLLTIMTFSGWIAVLSGWYVAEIGRQPWIVYHVIKTADVVAKHTPATMFTSLTAYLILYIFLLVSYFSVIFYLARSASKKNQDKEGEPNGSNGQKAQDFNANADKTVI